MNIKVLASSSEGNAYLIGDGTTHLLIECGIPMTELKIRTNFFEPMPDACLVSHSHLDHAKSMKDVVRLGIPCYMSKETYAEKGGDLPPSMIGFMEHQKSFDIGTLTVLPLEMKHDVYCLGFYIYSHTLKESLFFATDTCYIPYTLPPMDYLMVEANYNLDILNERIMKGDVDIAMKNRLAKSHMEISNTLLWLKRQDLSKAKRIYLLHLSYGSADAAQFKKGVEMLTGIPTEIAGG